MHFLAPALPLLLLLLAMPAAAGPKLYDMSAMLRESQQRLQAVAPAAAPAVVAAAPKPASDVPGRRGWIDEIVVGGWLHDPFRDKKDSETFDVNAELLFRPLTFWSPESAFWRFLAQPRPMLGGSLNTEGGTNTVYGGLDWTWQSRSGLFIGVSFGLAWHDGNLEQEIRQCGPAEMCTLPGNRAYVDTGKPSLGSRVLFRESLAVGWRFGPHGLSIYGAHVSNGSLLDDDNDALNFLGLRYGYRFR